MSPKPTSSSARARRQNRIAASRQNFSVSPKDDARVDPVLRRFLSQSYEFKSVADYLTGDEAVTSAAEAAEAVATSKRFVAHFAALVTLPESAPDASSNEAP
jgi:hypothetical protein